MSCVIQVRVSNQTLFSINCELLYMNRITRPNNRLHLWIEAHATKLLVHSFCAVVNAREDFPAP